MSLERNIVFVDGVRTPFLRAGTGYADLATYELGHLAIKGLLSRTGINPTEIDGVVMGNSRSSLAGVDLNRRWSLPNSVMHPV